MKTNHPSLYEQLTILDSVAAAVNFIWEEKYEDAIAELEKIEALPIKKQDVSTEKARAYTLQD